MLNYQIVAKIYESANSLIYRAILTADNHAIILKILKENVEDLVLREREREVVVELPAL